MKKQTIYDTKLSKIENNFEKLRNKIEKNLKPFIESKVKKLNIPCEYTQHSMYRIDGGDNYEPAFEQLVNFCYTLSDDYRIQILFSFSDGKFKWW